jgi:hypothetical protein
VRRWARGLRSGSFLPPLATVTSLINTESSLITIETQELNSGASATTLTPVVEQLTGIQQQLATLLTQEATSLASDPAFQTDLGIMVTNQGALTNLLAQVGQSSS